MVKVEGTSVQITRGDTTRFAIVLKDREVPAEAEALFTVKKKPWRHDDAIIQKTIPVVLNKVNVLLEPEETKLEPGGYVWDVRIKEPYEDGEIILTPMAYGGFHVLEAIGDE